MGKRITKWTCALLAAAVFMFSHTAYFKQLDALPDKITLPEDTSITLDLPFGVFLDADTDEPMSVLSSSDETLCTNLVAQHQGTGEGAFKLFGVVPVGAVSLQVVQQKKLCASGDLIGIAMLTDGALVVGTSRVMDESGIWRDPASDAGICVGDLITHMDGVRITDAADITAYLSELSADSVRVTICRREKTLDVVLHSVREMGTGLRRLGLWVRDSTAGIGTLTYADMEEQVYGALGHGILDQDTQSYLTVLAGRVVHAEVSNITLGKIGQPGQLHADYALDQAAVGDITANNQCGLFGNLLDPSGIWMQNYPIGLSSQVEKGEAQLICSVQGQNDYYDCVIENVFRQSGGMTKNMLVRVTDQRLLSLTGGIVQGMSGSPIIQDGKLVGAVTHVLVNDPTRGYGIFIENMLDAAG